jgi:hypothetical protein
VAFEVAADATYFSLLLPSFLDWPKIFLPLIRMLNMCILKYQLIFKRKNKQWQKKN